MELRLLFLCTGNSCRSQMAEAWVRRLSNNIIVKSAGIESHGQNAMAIEVMAEVGIDMSRQQSIRVNCEMLEWADILITLCDYAQQQCPIINPYTVKLHLPLVDPAKKKGDGSEIKDEFRQARDDIKQKVDYILQQIQAAA